MKQAGTAERATASMPDVAGRATEALQVPVARDDLTDIGNTIYQIGQAVAQRRLYDGRWRPGEALQVVSDAFVFLAAGERPWTTDAPSETIFVEREALLRLGAETSQIAADLDQPPATPDDMIATVARLAGVLRQIARLRVQ